MPQKNRRTKFQTVNLLSFHNAVGKIAAKSGEDFYYVRVETNPMQKGVTLTGYINGNPEGHAQGRTVREVLSKLSGESKAIKTIDATFEI